MGFEQPVGMIQRVNNKTCTSWRRTPKSYPTWRQLLLNPVIASVRCFFAHKFVQRLDSEAHPWCLRITPPSPQSRVRKLSLSRMLQLQ